VSELIRVLPECLHVSAAKLEVNADELQLRHTAANGRIEAAQTGVPAGSVAALSAAVAKCQVDTQTAPGDVSGADPASSPGTVQCEHIVDVCAIGCACD
jgi:hypothetical protein